MRTLSYERWVVGLFALAFLASVTRAQDQPATNPNQPEAPIPAYHSPLAGATDNGPSDENPSDLVPDTNSLSGARLLTIGTPTTRTYWQPSFDYSGSADSNPVVAQGTATGTGNTWTGWSTLTGTIDVHRISGNNNLILSYVGGGMIGIGGPGEGGVIQELNAVDGITFRRWTLSLIEQLSYVPSNGIGVNGIGGEGAGGLAVPPLNPGLTPGQPFLTASGQGLTSSSDGEAALQLTPRTSLTFVGGYLFLKYFDNSTLDYGGFNARAGYNYQWTRKDTLAVFYTYNQYNYNTSQQSINSQSVQLSYARRVTGRLAFQMAAGPQFASFQQPIPTTGDTLSPTGIQLSWTANAGLEYRLKQGSLGASYSHAVSGGSGVLAGSIGDSVTGTASRPITRAVDGSVTVGYYRSHGVALGTSIPSITAQTYDYWSAGGTLSRAWGRSLSLNASYQMQYQTSGTNFCVGVACGTSYFRNLISVGVSWRGRPLLF